MLLYEVGYSKFGTTKVVTRTIDMGDRASIRKPPRDRFQISPCLSL
jgi:hypothetical protein